MRPLLAGEEPPVRDVRVQHRGEDRPGGPREGRAPEAARLQMRAVRLLRRQEVEPAPARQERPRECQERPREEN